MRTVSRSCLVLRADRTASPAAAALMAVVISCGEADLRRNPEAPALIDDMTALSTSQVVRTTI